MKPQDLIGIHLKAASLQQDILCLTKIKQEDGDSMYINDAIETATNEYISIMKQIISVPNKIKEEKPDVFNMIADKVFGNVKTI